MTPLVAVLVVALVACSSSATDDTAASTNRPATTRVAGSTLDVPVKPAADPRQRARENLVHALINSIDFRYLH